MAHGQPPTLKAKISDRPTLRDLVNYVVPQASPKWYYLGLQLFDPRDEGVLHRMKMEANKPLEEQCTEAFRHWLETEKNATWNYLINSLNSRSVNLPIVAEDITKMLNSHRTSAITEGSLSHDLSDVDFVENDDHESDEKAPDFHSKKPMLSTSAQAKVPTCMSMTGRKSESHLRSQSLSALSLPATDVDWLCNQKYQYTNEQKECTEDKNQHNEQQMSKKVENVNEELAKQLKELTKQLDTYENERKERIKVEDQLREADKEKLDTFKQLLEKERLKDEELKKEIAQLRNQVKLACEKQATQQKDLSTLETKHEVEDVEKLYYKELNTREAIYEEKLNKVVDQFNRQLKDCKEAHRKELDNLQLKVEELKKEEAKKFEDSEVVHRKELYDLQLKVELKGERVKENDEINRKELNNLRLKVEELKKVELKGEKVKKLEENDEIHRKELNNLKLKVEELKKKHKECEEKSMRETYILTQMTERLKSDEAKLEQFKEQKEALKKEIDKLKKEIEKLKKEIETLKRENKQLTITNKTLVTKEDIVSQFKDHEKSFSKEFNEKFEMLERNREENKSIYKKISDVQRELDKHLLKQQLEAHKRDEKNVKPETEFNTPDKNLEQLNQHNSKFQQDINDSKIVDGKSRESCLSTDGQKKQNVTTKLSLHNVPGEIHTNSATTTLDVINAQYNHTCSSAGSSTPLPPPGFPLKQPDHIRPSSYRQAVTQQSRETKCPSSSAQLKPSPPDTPAHLSIQSNSKVIVDNRRKVTGNQPSGGTMITTNKQSLRLCGYEKCGTIQINYHIPRGVQSKEHPNPGQHFNGISETAYLPDSPEGRKVARLLRKAFDAKLIFTIGTSGATNAVVWSDIHHKTNMRGGPSNNGYPDPTYLSKVVERLAAKGIKE